MSTDKPQIEKESEFDILYEGKTRTRDHFI